MIPGLLIIEKDFSEISVETLGILCKHCHTEYKMCILRDLNSCSKMISVTL